MIRTTHSGLFDLVAQNTLATSGRIRQLEEQATTGSTVNRPSDAPALLGEIHRLRASVADQAVYEQNASSAMSVLDVMDGALASVGDLLTRARELAVQMASETMNTEERALAATEVASLRETLIDLANTDYAGRYVFAGTATDAPAFDETGVYQGTSDVPSTQTGADAWVQTGADGGEIFTGDADLMAMLSDLQTALESDDTAGISGALDDIDLGVTALSRARGELGFAVNHAEDAIEVAQGLAASLAARLDEVSAADPAQTYLELAEMRNAYAVTLQVASSASQLSLFDLMT